jgi:hypothetical protein
MRGAVVCLVAGLLAAPLAAAADDERPPFSFLRQREDWSGFADAAREGGRLDRLKYVPLNDDGTRWASFGASVRLRLEAWESFGFGGSADADDLFSLTRLLFHGDFHVSPRFRLFLEGKSATAGGRSLPGGTRPSDADTLDVQQGFVDTRLTRGGPTTLTLRVGRQGLQFGRQRLVSPLPWGNSLRSWDGATLLVSRGAWAADLFWTRPVTIERTAFNEPDDAREFYGVHAARRSARLQLETYALGLGNDRPVSYNGTVGAETRRTYGARAVLRPGKPWSAEVEAAFQEGAIGSQGIEAWMGTVEGTWKPACRFQPVLRLAFDAASGDHAAGGRVQTFNQLFPLGHAYFGYADAFGRQNVVSPSLSLSLKATENLRVRAAWHAFRRESTADAVYNAGGGVVAAGSAGTSRDVATEADIVATVALSGRTSLEVGVSRVFVDAFLEQAGLGEDLTFGYVQFEFRF